MSALDHAATADRLREVRARFDAAVADSATADAELDFADHDYEDMGFLLDVVSDLQSRLGCVVEATYWDRPYDTRIDAIRGMCDLAGNGMTPVTDTPTSPAGSEAGQ